MARVRSTKVEVEAVRRSIRRFLVGTLSTMVVGGLVGLVLPAAATYPGSTSGRLAFFRIEDGNAEIFSVMPNGRGAQRLTHDPAFDACPAYSATGKQIVFCSSRSGAFEVWTMKANGRNQRQVTHFGGVALFPDPSPDGTKIAFEGSIPEADDSDIFVVNADGSDLDRLTEGDAFDFHAVWSPDGSRIAFAREMEGEPPQIWVMDADGSNQIQLTALEAGAVQPDWSPNGMSIAFDSAEDIFVMDADGTDVFQVTADPAVEFGPAWSPDGTMLAFVSERAEDEPRELVIVNADGTGRRFVTVTRGVPGWQPRGDRR